MKNYLKKTFYTILIFLTVPTSAGAQSIVTCGNQRPCTLGDLSNLIQISLEWIFKLASFIVAVMFMYAGFLLITAAGNASQIQKAKMVFKRVIIGFIIMFIAVLLIRQLLQMIGALPFFQGIITR